MIAITTVCIVSLLPSMQLLKNKKYKSWLWHVTHYYSEQTPENFLQMLPSQRMGSSLELPSRPASGLLPPRSAQPGGSAEEALR